MPLYIAVLNCAVLFLSKDICVWYVRGCVDCGLVFCWRPLKFDICATELKQLLHASWLFLFMNWLPKNRLGEPKACLLAESIRRSLQLFRCF
uniref:Putative secreted protein n=1 Tax=Ixodes ricinus TaxID=34613 RepID=A0A6B0U233_IXORI